MLEGVLGNLNNTFNTNNQTKNNPLEIKKSDGSNSSKTKSIIIVKKGEAGYMEAMDKDKDGEVTMEEFNSYCEENGVDDKTKLALLETIQSAKMTKKLQEKMEAQRKEQEEGEKDETTVQDENKDGIIYAKKGDEKYNEVMDENNNGVITYEEYIKYCQKKKGESSEDSSSEAASDTASKVKEAYSKSEPEEEGSGEEISIEAEA